MGSCAGKGLGVVKVRKKGPCGRCVGAIRERFCPLTFGIVESMSSRSLSGALLPFFGEGSLTKIDYRKKGTLILASTGGPSLRLHATGHPNKVRGHAYKGVGGSKKRTSHQRSGNLEPAAPRLGGGVSPPQLKGHQGHLFRGAKCPNAWTRSKGGARAVVPYGTLLLGALVSPFGGKGLLFQINPSTKKPWCSLCVGSPAKQPASITPRISGSSFAWLEALLGTSNHKASVLGDQVFQSGGNFHVSLEGRFGA